MIFIVSPFAKKINGGQYTPPIRAWSECKEFSFSSRNCLRRGIESTQQKTAQFPAALEDVKAAIRFLRANAKRFSLYPDHIGIMGESAGAYLSVMAGVTGNTREFDVGENPEYSSAVQAVCDWYGPTDFMDFGKENRFSRVPGSAAAGRPGGLGIKSHPRCDTGNLSFSGNAAHAADSRQSGRYGALPSE